MINTENLFKLTQPPSGKNPSIADCLKISENERFGRYIVTTRRLKCGEVIVIEKPFYKSLDKRSDCRRCVNCLGSSLNPVACTSCKSVFFCSEECRQFAWREFHKFECSSIDQMTSDDGFLMMIERSLYKALHVCGNLENLRKLVEGNKSETTVFDADMNKPGKDFDEKLILACFSLETSAPTEEEIKFTESFVDRHEYVKSVYETRDGRNFLKKFVLNLIGIMNRNSFTLHWKSPRNSEATGCGIFPFSSLINHSCSPNLSRVCLDGNLVLMTKHPIEENEQLFICYQ